jgi:hypothetical protein
MSNSYITLLLQIPNCEDYWQQRRHTVVVPVVVVEHVGARWDAGESPEEGAQQGAHGAGHKHPRPTAYT